MADARERELRGNATEAEQRLWFYLRDRRLRGWKFCRQVRIGRYIADFVCRQARLIVELDGGQHVERAAYDARRTAALEAAGYRVLRFWNDEALLWTADVLEAVLSALEEDGSA